MESQVETGDDLQNLSDQLSADLQDQIRRLASYDILSPRWVELTNTISRISQISKMEADLPKESKASTLWECEELALRNVLEDGKLNLCLRNLVDYKKFERGIRSEGYAGLSVKQRSDLDNFEKGMGIILRNAWNHIEALQTTDVILLVSHIGEVLSEDAQDVARIETFHAIGDLSDRQEVMVLHYLYGIVANVDEVGEERIMPPLRGHRVFLNIALFLREHHTKLSEGILALAVETMDLICDTEDFQTYEGEYARGPSDVGVFKNLGGLFLDQMAGNYDQRRKIRSLLNFLGRIR